MIPSPRRVARRWFNAARLPVAYHVSKSKNDRAILEDGIRARRGPVYVWRDLDMAEWFANFHHDSEGSPRMTIWLVDTSGLDLQRDPETEDMSEWGSRWNPGEFGGGFMYDGVIGPERIIRKLR